MDKKANYIDGFVLPVPKKHLETYRKVAQQIATIWKEYGALEYHEFVGDDMFLEGTSSFSDFIDAKMDETVVFGWVVFEDREARNLANTKVAADTRMTDLIAPLSQKSRIIFDPKRMAYGGFKLLV